MGLFAKLGVAREKLTLVGLGVSGKVYLCEKNHQCCVVKTYHCKEQYETRKDYHQRVLHEYEVLRLLHQENFIQVFKYKVLLDGLTVKMYMEAGSTDLGRMFSTSLRLELEEVLCLWKQLCIGVQYLHSQGLCHRDLKLENLVLARNSTTLKILDLATACKSGPTSPARGIVGSKSYMAPETYSLIAYDGQGADMWSVAIILYYLSNHGFPWAKAVEDDEKFRAFADKNTTHVVTSVTDPIYNANGIEVGPSQVLRLLPAESVDVARQLFQVEANARIDASSLTQDSWFHSIAYCNGGVLCGAKHKLLG